jgi:hypothetical protein
MNRAPRRGAGYSRVRQRHEHLRKTEGVRLARKTEGVKNRRGQACEIAYLFLHVYGLNCFQITSDWGSGLRNCVSLFARLRFELFPDHLGLYESYVDPKVASPDVWPTKG